MGQSAVPEATVALPICVATTGTFDDAPVIIALTAAMSPSGMAVPPMVPCAPVSMTVRQTPGLLSAMKASSR
jgi:hypothetical protein